MSKVAAPIWRCADLEMVPMVVVFCVLGQSEGYKGNTLGL